MSHRVNFLGVALIFLAGTSIAEASTIPQSGLVAHYTFDGNVSDQSGNANDGTPGGNFAFVAGREGGQALRLLGDGSLFYASGGYVSLPAFDSTMNDGFTLSLWAKDEVIGGDPVGGQSYISFGVLDHAKVAIALNKNLPSGPFIRFDMDYRQGNPADTAHLLEAGHDIGDLGTYASDWKNLVMVYTPGTMAGYLNGTKVVEGAFEFGGFPLAPAALGRDWWSGGTASSARMSATYDDVAIYNRALSDSEVRALYTGEPTAVPDSGSTLLLVSSALGFGLLFRRRV